MGFYTQHCPNCGKSVSKDAQHCNDCGCPTDTAWSTCAHCGSAVGANSKFCWRCGDPQDAEKRRLFYGDRWHRSPGDFAVRVALKAPEAVLHKGLQIDEGTVALLFQGGKFKGLCEAGLHTTDTFFARMLGFDKGQEAHAILLDTRGAEVDFALENLRLQNHLPVDMRLRLLFQVNDPKLFAVDVVRDNDAFAVADLSARFQGDVGEAAQRALASRTLEDIFSSPAARDLVEAELLASLQPVLGAVGLRIEGVRLAQFGGPAYDEIRSKLGEIDDLNRRLEINRRMRDAIRVGKIDAYRDETQLQETLERIAHETNLSAVEREEERKRILIVFEQKTQLDTVRHEYDLRRAEIMQRLDEQKLRHQSELADAVHAVALKRVGFEEDIRQQHVRFGVGQQQQVHQARTDLEVARQGIEALKLVKQTKLEAQKAEGDLELQHERERLAFLKNASTQALLATLTGEQADRVLKLAELEMRRGLSPEQALALVVEKSPEIAPEIARVIQARRAPAKPEQPSK